MIVSATSTTSGFSDHVLVWGSWFAFVLEYPEMLEWPNSIHFLSSILRSCSNLIEKKSLLILTHTKLN